MNNIAEKEEKKMINNDLTTILRGYENKWVVLSPDNTKIMASGDSLESIEDSIELGYVFMVQPFVAFIPHLS